MSEANTEGWLLLDTLRTESNKGVNSTEGWRLSLRGFYVFAQQLNELEAMMAGIDQGMDGKGSVILRGRNDKAFQVLSGEIQSGKKRLAVFYGAGHMPDMDRRLNEMGFRRVREEWLVAWDLMRKG